MDGRTDRYLAGAVLIVLALWLVLLARLFHLQVIEGDRFRVSAERNSVRTHRTHATRGMILDRNGTILVDSRPSFDVLVVPHEIGDAEWTLARLARLMGEPEEGLLERYGRPQGRARFQALSLARDLGRDRFIRVEARRWALRGVLTQVIPLRDYRFGDSAAHVLGRLGEIGPDQLRRREYQGYRRGDVVGRGGIEELLDRVLRGRDGGRNVLVDARGRELEQLGEVAPQPGRNVWLTLDHRLQQVAEAALDEAERAGAVVALDPRNGEVRVLASRPAFDPNHFASGVGHEEWAALRGDPRKPLHNRATRGQYPPGSTYKVVTLLAGLEEGVVRAGFEVRCAGSFRLGRRRYRCWRAGGHGLVDAHRALVESCDVFFYKLGLEVGVDRLAKYARALGLGAPTGIELEGERSGLVPTREWKRRRFGEPWLEGETVSLAIGQGFNLWTPLQLAQAYATIAMGGRRLRPHLVQRIEDPEGGLLHETRPQELPAASLSAASLSFVQRALRGVVADEHGTGYAMRRLPGGVEAAGKTGTAQVIGLGREGGGDDDEIPLRYRDHAWFVTYLPASAPRLVVAVLVEHGGHGASAAAPIAARVARAFLEQEGTLHARH
ncbi:MAG: penicillin-binding protein 2 [Myxococcota bacterium]